MVVIFILNRDCSRIDGAAQKEIQRNSLDATTPFPHPPTELPDLVVGSTAAAWNPDDPSRATVPPAQTAAPASGCVVSATLTVPALMPEIDYSPGPTDACSGRPQRTESPNAVSCSFLGPLTGDLLCLEKELASAAPL
jgi:hypothetical protein